MPKFEIHHDTYHVDSGEDIPVVEAKDAYEAAIMFAARWAPVSIRRINREVDGDSFIVSPIGQNDGIILEVFEA